MHREHSIDYMDTANTFRTDQVMVDKQRTRAASEVAIQKIVPTFFKIKFS